MPISNIRRSLRLVLLAGVVVLSASAVPTRLQAQDVDKEFAAKAEKYRLTEAKLPSFEAATRALAAAVRKDPALLLSLKRHDRAARATAEKIVARSGLTLDDYELFMGASLFGSMAMLAIDMKDQETIKAMPSMVRLNAAFVKKHEKEYRSLKGDLEVLQGDDR